MNSNTITSAIKKTKQLRALAQQEKPQDPALIKAIDEAGASLTKALLIILERPEQNAHQTPKSK